MVAGCECCLRGPLILNTQELMDNSTPMIPAIIQVQWDAESQILQTSNNHIK